MKVDWREDAGRSANYNPVLVFGPELSCPAVWMPACVLTSIIPNGGEAAVVLKLDEVFHRGQHVC
jgi:hypothetical protein